MNNGQISVSNDNMTRISVNDFEFLNSNSEFDKAMKCQSELMSDPEPEYIALTPSSCCVTRGWSTRREDEGGRRVHYLWRRSQTPEEGYINCHFRDDTNPVLGLYVLYPSE